MWKFHLIIQLCLVQEGILQPFDLFHLFVTDMAHAQLWGCNTNLQVYGQILKLPMVEGDIEMSFNFVWA